jgi:hypothetical protein
MINLFFLFCFKQKVTLFRTNIDSQLYNYLLWWQKIYVLKETCYFFDETEKMSKKFF